VSQRIKAKNQLRKLSNSLNSIENLFENCGGNVVDKFYKQIYLNVRCSLFHAKENTKKLVPQNLEDRKKVAKALDILTNIVLMLASNLLHINRENAVITNIGFSNLIGNNFEFQRILLSESKEDLSELENLSNPIYQQSFYLPAKFSKELSVPGLSFYVGEVTPSKINNLKIINRFALQFENELFTIHKVDGLTTENVDELQIYLGCRLENKNLPKQRFHY